MRTAVVASGLALTLSLGPVAASAQEVLPPGSTVHGKTIGEWTQDWWNWWFSFPAAVPPFGDEPLTDTTGEHANDGQSGPVFFINGFTGPMACAPVTLTFSVPGDVHILVPLMGFIFVASGGEACEDIAPLVEAAVDGIDSLLLSVDGVAVPESELVLHRHSTGCFPVDVAVEGNAGNEPVGIYPGSYASGYSVMISPLGSGTHVIRTVAVHSAFGFCVDVTNNISAAPSIPALSASGAWATGVALVVVGVALLRTRKKEGRLVRRPSYDSASRSALASFRSAVSKPSLNQP